MSAFSFNRKPQACALPALCRPPVIHPAHKRRRLRLWVKRIWADSIFRSAKGDQRPAFSRTVVSDSPALTVLPDRASIRSFRQNLKECLRSVHPGFRIDPGGRKVAGLRRNPAANPVPQTGIPAKKVSVFRFRPAFQTCFGQLTARSTWWEVGPSTTCGPGDPLCFVVPG